MNFDDLRPPRPVGTGGGAGWMWGPCACPRWDATVVPHGPLAHRMATRTGTRPPPSPTSAPCPYRTDTYTQIKTFKREEQEAAKEKRQWTSQNQKMWRNGQ